MMLTALLSSGSVRMLLEIGSNPLSLATICTAVSPVWSRAFRRVCVVEVCVCGRVGVKDYTCYMIHTYV